MWAYYENNEWTGIAIAILTGPWAKPYKPITYHIRNYPQNQDLADAPSLESAKLMVELYH